MYPKILPECRTGLLLYGAGLMGKNDGQFFDAAGLEALVVDFHMPHIRKMSRIYPEFDYIHADAIPWIEDALKCGYQWDIVSVDCPQKGTDALDILVGTFSMDDLRRLAARQFVFGAPTAWKVPDGATVYPRSEEFCWWAW